jgi:hypothetical protein
LLPVKLPKVKKVKLLLKVKKLLLKVKKLLLNKLLNNKKIN